MLRRNRRSDNGALPRFADAIIIALSRDIAVQQNSEGLATDSRQGAAAGASVSRLRLVDSWRSSGPAPGS